MVGIKFKQKVICSLTKETTVNLEQYLRTKHWQIVRAKYKRDGTIKRCSICSSMDSLQIIHKHYRTLGREQSTDLMCLCRVHIQALKQIMLFGNMPNENITTALRILEKKHKENKKKGTLENEYIW